MKNNEMIEYKENFITKIKKFFNKIFGKSEKQYKVIQENLVNEMTEEKPSNFIDHIKVDIKAVNFLTEKKNFLEEINGNIEMLNILSIDRLMKLEEYYDSVIAENNRKIKKLKATA